MSKIETHNEEGVHNGTMTGRPRIFFPGKPGEFDKMLGVVHYVEFNAAHTTPGTPEYAELERRVPKVERDRLRALRLLRYVAESDELASRKALADAAELLFEDTKFRSMFVTTKQPREAAQSIYATYFTDSLKRARLMMRCTTRGEFIPVLRCPDAKTALYAFAAFRGVEACLNCQKLFAVDAPRPDGSSSDRYCTAACGQRYRQQVYRLRQKEKSSRRREKR